MTSIHKAFVTGIAAATLGLGVAASSTPAAAWGYCPYWGRGAGAAAAGLALGAAAAAAPYYTYSYPGCQTVREPVVDHWGTIIRYHRVRVCY